MAFRPPSLRTSRPRSPVNRSTPWGREVLIIFGLAVGMIVVLLAVHTSLINTTLRLVLGFSAEADGSSGQAVGLGRFPGMCSHNGMDASLTLHQEEVLQSLNIVSLADRMSLMCHLEIADISVPVAGGFRDELRKIYPTRICCLDFDTFLSAEGIAFVGRPSLVALHMAQHRQKNSIATIDKNRNETIHSADVEAVAQQIEHDLLRNVIPKAEIESADPRHKFSQPLKDIALVVGRVLSTQANHLVLYGANATRVTLEPKLTNTAAPARTPLERGELISFKQARAAASHGGQHALYIGDALQLIAQELYQVATGLQLASTGLPLWEYFGVIIDPVRYDNVWDRLMLSTPASRVLGSQGVDGPAGVTVLVTEPQLWYVMSLKDLVLDALTSGSPVIEGDNGHGALQLPAGLEPEQYCAWLLLPPTWAREVAPSVKMQRKCTKWFDVEVVSGRSNAFNSSKVVLHKRARSRRKSLVSGESWAKASRRIAKRPALLAWVVDTAEDYDRLVYLGDWDGLRSSFAISNRAQMLHAEIASRFPRA